MYFHNMQIVLQEVPGHISICFSISGCTMHCEGCHSPFLWKQKNGQKLTLDIFTSILNQYKGFSDCALFMGGEWHPEELITYLKLAKKKGYKTCLYSGEDHIDPNILAQLDWVKTGKWIAKRGGLDALTTNQKFIEVKSNTILNHLFIKNP
ncbi:anaerobic ribonucleoside-triphosphate reductase activating protein [Mariniflexile ostreae]|uniref:Anaerobic ribonucleoside-triphosphate reductase activating protein n=1 Tax=Mariniflexile ostreae TaxID=1520892 RepID=A0ABV5FBW9_9FLAO